MNFFLRTCAYANVGHLTVNTHIHTVHGHIYINFIQKSLLPVLSAFTNMTMPSIVMYMQHHLSF